MKKLIFILTAALFLVACGNGETKDAAKEVNESKSGFQFDGKVLQTDEVKVEIKDTKVIPVGEEGNEHGDKPVFAIWYGATNLTDDDMTPIDAWIDNFEAVQDNSDDMVNKLGVGSSPDSAHLDTQLNIIKKDGTVENSIAYELDDLETPVKLTARNGVFGDDIDSHEYEIK